MINSCIISMALAVSSLKTWAKDPLVLVAAIALPIVLFLVWEVIREKRFNKMEHTFYKNLRQNQPQNSAPRKSLIKSKLQIQEQPEAKAGGDANAPLEENQGRSPND
jgi:uncharacterized membrane protein YjgN (DUF898 family)